MDSVRLLRATLRLLPVLLAVGLASACSSGNDPVKLTPAEAAAAKAPPPSSASGGSAATAKPTMPANPHAGGAPMTAPKSAGSLQFSVPEGWVTQVPSSSMRKAQFLLPREGADPEDAQLVLFYFGGEGGSVEANLDRWAGEFTQADGKSSREAMVTTTRTVNDMKVTEVAVSGRFAPAMMPGQSTAIVREKWSMLGAIVETPSGPYYAKLTGPGATVSRWEPSFRQWISSLKSTSG